MSHHINISQFQRRTINSRNFFDSNLDMFDPFNPLDMSMLHSHNDSMKWLLGPPRMNDRPNDKFRITLPVTGYNKDDFDVRFESDKLIIDNRSNDSFRKQFDVPTNADASRLTSFLTPDGTLVAEIPLRSFDQSLPIISDQKFNVDNQPGRMMPVSGRRGSIFQDDLFKDSFNPKIIENNGQKTVNMSIRLAGFTPDQISLSVKDRELILKAEHNERDERHSSRQYIYKQVTLPTSTDIDKMASTFENDILKITAPVR